MHVLKRGFSWLSGRTLAAHLVRGAAAVLLFTLGYTQLDSSPMSGMVLMFSALIPLGGCPACWLGGTVGAACAVRPRKPEGLRD